MHSFASIWGILLLVLRIAVPIYLYSTAQQKRLPYPGLWILFGVFMPLEALMLYYLIIFIKEELKSRTRS